MFRPPLRIVQVEWSFDTLRDLFHSRDYQCLVLPLLFNFSHSPLAELKAPLLCQFCFLSTILKLPRLSLTGETVLVLNTWRVAVGSHPHTCMCTCIPHHTFHTPHHTPYWSSFPWVSLGCTNSWWYYLVILTFPKIHQTSSEMPKLWRPCPYTPSLGSHTLVSPALYTIQLLDPCSVTPSPGAFPHAPSYSSCHPGWKSPSPPCGTTSRKVLVCLSQFPINFSLK